MKMTMLAIIVLASAVYAPTQETTTSPSLSVDELNQRDVIGRLGLPLGTATEIQAEVVAGRVVNHELNTKGYDGLYLLRVIHVGAKKLSKPQLLEFSVPGHTGVKLANDIFELHELETGNKTGGLTDEQIKNLEKDYVGKSVRLVVYEVGGYSGIPRELPKDIRVWAGRGFHFSTSLIVLTDREEKKQRPALQSPFFEP